MNILVIGAGGQLGQTFKKAEKQPNASWSFTDRSTLDLLDSSSIEKNLDDFGAELVINCAAYTAVDRAETEHEIAKRVNCDAVAAIANWCAKNGSALIHYSTDYVFDGGSEAPYTESSIPNPLSSYGRTKLQGERAFLESGCKGICFRTSWVHSNFGANFYLTMKRLFSEREDLRVVDDQRGTPTTTGFVVNNTLKIIDRQHLLKSAGRVVHLVPAGHTTWHGFARYIYEQLSNSNTQMTCKNITAIRSSELDQIAQRPMNSTLSNALFESMLAERMPAWKIEHRALYEAK